MSKTLVIEVPDELQQQLLKQARQQNISLETLVLQSLSKVATVSNWDSADPILPLLGTLSAEVSDIGENHDQYIGNALYKEINIAK